MRRRSVVLQQNVNRSHEFLSQKLTTSLCRELIRIRKVSCGVKDTQSRASVNTKSRGMLGRSHASPRGEVSRLQNFLPSFTRSWLPSPFLLSVSLPSVSLPRAITKTTRVIDVPSTWAERMGGRKGKSRNRPP